MATYLERLRNNAFFQRLNRSLLGKLAAAFGVIALLSLLVGITALLSVNVSNERLRALVVTSQLEPDLWQQAVATFVEARTEDITFLRVYPERGFTFANTQHVRSWERQINRLNDTLLELQTLSDEAGNLLVSAETQAEIDTLLAAIEEYAAKFRTTVDIVELNDGGQSTRNIGQTFARLQEVIDPLESQELSASLMRMRHLELDFALTGNEEYVEGHEAEFERLNGLIDEALGDGAAKASVLAALSIHQNQFVATVNSRRFVESNIAEYQTLAAAAEANLRTQLAGAVAVADSAETGAITTIRNSIILLALLSLAAFVVSLMAALTIARGINLQVINILDMFGRLQAGDFSARAVITTPDELGQIGESINGVLDNNAELIQTQDEAQQIQRSIARLLNDITTAAEGDLTAEAVVTDDITGAIADSFNFMVEQLREVITQVRDASLQVSSSANEIQTTAEHLSQGSRQQSDQILDTTSAIDEMSVSIQRVSDNAALCATVSEQARANSDMGAEAVQQTILSMGQIKEHVGRTAQQLTKLRASMREIDSVVRLINNIAERTGILAINASVQAAGAGSASQSFALVASEIDDLAQRSAEATQQISRLVRQIQRRAVTATSTVNATNLEVEQGIRLANAAGERLLEIESVAERLAELIRQISRAATQQARGSETIAQSMTDISQVTRQNAEGTQEATSSIRNLARLAEELRASVSAFRLSASEAAFAAD